MKNDAGTWTDTGDYTLSDAPHSIEVHVKKATGVSNNDGFCTVWVDEDFVTPAIDITGVDLYNSWKEANRFRVGQLAKLGTLDDTFYIDEITVRDDGAQIGTSATPPTINDPGDATLAAIGVTEAITLTGTVTDGGSDVTLRLQCTEALGDVDLADLTSGVTVQSGTRGSHDVTFEGTPAEVQAALADFEYTPTASGADSGITVTIDDQVNTAVSVTFTITNHYMIVTGADQPDLNASLATILVTNAVAETATFTVKAIDAGGRSDTETANVTTSIPASGQAHWRRRGRRKFNAKPYQY
jgi:hypothetical protein